MKTSLLTPVCVLLSLTAPLTAAANPTAPLPDPQTLFALLPETDADAGPTQPVAFRWPAAVKLNLPQALRATSLAAPSLQAPAEWLAHMQRLGRSDSTTPPATPDSTRHPVAVPG